MDVDINSVMQQAKEAFQSYQFCSGADKKTLLYSMAEEIENLGEELLKTASEESNLPIARFEGERERTCRVFRMFGDWVNEGSWVEAVIDDYPSKRDMRKMLIPLGSIVVFGASNFPLAYSTPGGDTVSALAAGCPVIVKGHPSHPRTSALIATAMEKAIEKSGVHKSVFQLVQSSSFEDAKKLVQHPITAGVGFTGSLSGGRALYDYAQEREVPIPVFSEMGSTNPVLLLEDAMKTQAADYAKAFRSSITMGVGQFCTNPGIQLGVKSGALDNYIQLLAEELAKSKAYKMLHGGIHKNYLNSMAKVLNSKGVKTLYHAGAEGELMASPALGWTTGKNFAENPDLHHEVFGPFSLVVACDSMEELISVWSQMKGQLTTTIIGTDNDLKNHTDLVNIARNLAGRVVFNYTPTGVEVGDATVHGGPYPATTDPRFTSVGMEAIYRWVRPICYQDCPEYLLPEELKTDNPLGIMRKYNGEFKR